MEWEAQVAPWSNIHLPMQEARVRSLGGKDPLEKETHSGILAWNIPWMGSLAGCSLGAAKSQTRRAHTHTHTHRLKYPMGSGLPSCWETRSQTHQASFLSQFFEFTKYNYFELFLEVYFHESSLFFKISTVYRVS